MVAVWVQVAGIIVAAVGIMVAHEATHLAVARLAGPITITHEQWLQIEVRFVEGGVSPAVQRLVALAPTLVGLLVAALAVLTGVWDWLGEQEPYYARRIVLFGWLLYAHASPRDIRSALWPEQTGSEG